MFKRIVVFIVLVLLGWVNVQAQTDVSSEIERLEKIIAECKDPLKVPPGIFKQIKTLQGIQPRPDYKQLRNITNEGLVHVFVDSVIYPEIQTNFDQFISDLQADSFTVMVTEVWSQTPEIIRSTLQSEYASGLVGVILVGDVPAAWMQTFSMESYYTSYFPTDYFYMDLNGTWVDNNADGFYDNLSGTMEPEIWSGRITPTNCLFGDEVKLLNQYFIKNHAYRTGSLSLPDRALGYLELTWYPQLETYLGWVYDNVDVIDDENTTTALHYKYMLQQGYEWVHLLSHSSPWGSTFFLHNDTYGGGSVFSYEMPLVNPQANFVLLNACSNAKYTETNNLGQSYLFGSDYVLAVIGETKIMYGDDFYDLYASLGNGKNLGESFLDWIWYTYEWFWGCNIFGDPTLKPHGNGNPLKIAGFSSPSIGKGITEWDTSPVDISSFTDGNPSACVDHSGNIWAAWNAGRDVRANLWASHYNGTSWTTPQEVAFHVDWDFHPSMVTDRTGKVWMIWQSYRSVENYIDGWDIYSVYNNGTSWSSPVKITPADPYDVEPKSAVDSSGKVWAVWRAERKPNSDIMYSYYNGATWSANAYVASSSDEERDPVITVAKDGKVWVVWYAKKNGNWDIYAKYYNGSSWSSEIQVTNDPGYDLQPSVTADSSGRVWVIWRSNRNENLDIYSKYYNGTVWSSDVPVTTDFGDDLNPSVTYNNGNRILATWQSNRDGDWNIYQSIYDGAWSNPQPVTSDAGNQILPVAFYDGNNHFGSVFQGDQEVNWNIYYSHATAQWFAPTVNYSAGDGPTSVFCADLDGDTNLDLVVANSGGGNVSILKNNGNGTFQSAVDYGAGGGPWSVFCTDLDGDGDLDLAVANYYSNNISILKNNGDGTFQTKVDYDAGWGPYSVFCADLDNDNDLDLAVANESGNNVSILKNNGDGTYQTAVNYEAGDTPWSVFCADLDGDGDLDLAVANWNSDNVSILKNNGDGTFQSATNYVAIFRPSSVYCADLDEDGDLDLAVANWNSDNVSILKNNGDGTFQSAAKYGAGSYPRSVFCADLDGDTYLDLTVANYNSNNVSVLKNNGDGTYQAAVNYGTGNHSWSVFCANLDGDGDLDLAVANLGSDSVSILMNLTQLPGNSPPYSFALLSPADAETTSSIVEFDWASTQDVNLSDQIRYDLYLSTVPGFNPDSTAVFNSLVCSQLTDTLHVGRYYWKVKAYDNWGAVRWSNQTWHLVYFIRGDVNMDETMDVGDVVYLINYLFKSGTASDPLAVGDANCDSVVDVGDVVYLINYLFKGGPPPGC
jgi:6-phosphogluconolactonase (cycloisomerase 2 family)